MVFSIGNERLRGWFNIEPSDSDTQIKAGASPGFSITADVTLVGQNNLINDVNDTIFSFNICLNHLGLIDCHRAIAFPTVTVEPSTVTTSLVPMISLARIFPGTTW